MRTRPTLGALAAPGSPDGARPPERHLDQRRPDRRDVAQDPVVAQQQHRRGRPQHQPQPAPVGLAGEDRPVEAVVRRTTSTPPTAARSGCRSGPARSGWPSPTSRPGSLRSMPAHRAPSPVPGLLGDHEHVDRPVELAGARHAGGRGPRPVAGRHREVGDRPARAHRPRQVRREAAGRAQVVGERVVRRLGRRGPPQRSGRPSPCTGQRARPSASAVSTSARAAGAPRDQRHGSTVVTPPLRVKGAGQAGRSASGVPGQDHRGSPARSPAARASPCRAGRAGRRSTGRPSQRAVRARSAWP